MLIENQKIKVRWNPSNREWYESRGYVFTKWHQLFIVKASELVKTSKEVVKIKCDYCNESYIEEFIKYFESLNKKKYDYCPKCRKNRNKDIQIKSINSEEIKVEEIFDSNYYQKNVLICGNEFIVVHSEGTIWYPISIFTRVLKRAPCTYNSETHEHYIKQSKKFWIKYTPNQPIKETIYLRESTLVEYLVKTNFSQLTLEHIDLQQKLHKYLGVFEINLDKNFLKTLKPSIVKQKVWNKKLIIKEIKKVRKRMFSLVSTKMYTEHKNLYESAVRHFGSWKAALTASGYDYTGERKKELNRLIKKCYSFETLLGLILSEMYDDVKKGRGKLRPDFIVNKNSHWIDAKLSEWTDTIGLSISKYIDHCEKLTIIYLRGDKKKFESIDEKLTIGSVYKLLYKLPVERREYYTELLDELYKDADAGQEEKLIEYNR